MKNPLKTRRERRQKLGRILEQYDMLTLKEKQEQRKFTDEAIRLEKKRTQGREYIR
jgi:hypothetical protein